MAVLLLAEVNNGELALDATAKAVTAAKALGEVHVLCAGASAAAAGAEAAKIDPHLDAVVEADENLSFKDIMNVVNQLRALGVKDVAFGGVEAGGKEK